MGSGQDEARFGARLRGSVLVARFGARLRGSVLVARFGARLRGSNVMTATLIT